MPFVWVEFNKKEKMTEAQNYLCLWEMLVAVLLICNPLHTKTDLAANVLAALTFDVTNVGSFPG